MRSILGAVPTGERLFKAGLRKTALCPSCVKGDVEECRKDVKNSFTRRT